MHARAWVCWGYLDAQDMFEISLPKMVVPTVYPTLIPAEPEYSAPA